MNRQGERVLYGVHGVCEIVGTEIRTVDRKRVEYYALEPLEQRGARFYVPTQNQAALSKMRPLLDASSLTELLHSKDAHLDAWIPNEGQRRNRYRELLGSGDRAELLRMVGSLYRHKSAQAALGKKFHLSDENFLRDAERLLCAEISYVLGMKPTEAAEYLRQTLSDTR